MTVKWIKLTTNIFDDEKIMLIEAMPSADSILVIWLKLLTLAGKQNNNGVFLMNDRIPYTDEMLATIFRRDVNTVRLALKTFESFGMVEIIDGVITIPNWEKHQTLDQLEQAKEQTRKRVARHREKQKELAQRNVTVTLPVTQCNGDRLDKDKDKEEDKNKSVRETTHTLFQRLRPEYSFSDSVADKMAEWVKYKTERKEPYKEQGMKSLLRQIENKCKDHGEEAVCSLIDECMAANWKGIIFDRLKQTKPQQNTRNKQATYTREEVKPEWMRKGYSNYMEYLKSEFADIGGGESIEDDPELMAQADAIRNKYKKG